MTNLLELSGRPKNKLVQLALDVAKVKPEKLSWPMLISEKYDGVYCIAYKDSEGVTIFSRTGEVYTSMRHIEKALKCVMAENTFIIFEAIGPKGTPQSTVSGWCRDTKAQHPELTAACHDLLTQQDFLAGPHQHRMHINRLRDLGCSLRGYVEGCSELFLIHHSRADSLEEAWQFAHKIIDRGGEGAVLKNPHALYAPGKRNQDMIKLKKGVSFDLEVVGVYEGRGKYTGTLGGLTCKWKDGELISVSGMTDAQRYEWWEYRSTIIGKIVQVDAMCVSSKGLLREPRFKGIREDKTEGDF